MTIACILDVEGEALTRDERAFFREVDPWALILFARSCRSREQVRALTGEIREALGRDALIFIDQEGGRVARLKPPEWPVFPALATYGALYASDREAAYEACVLHHRLIAHELRAIGVTADCAPCLDLRVEGADAVIGDRSFSSDPAIVGALGRAAMEGLHAGGVASVIKHVPGHGRAEGDSHFVLPRVVVGRQALAKDIAPFIACADAPMAMTAHIVYETLDETAPATCSPAVIEGVIRREIGFDGLLMSDDASMKALSGPLQARADAAIRAGCDVVMLCNASLDDRLALAAACPPLAGKALARAERAESFARAVEPFDAEAGWARFRALIGTGNAA
jgi:beta-N-acetylhexosaminidase